MWLVVRLSPVCADSAARALSFSSRFAVAVLTVTAKFCAFRLPRSFSESWLPLFVVVVVVVLDDDVVELAVASVCSPTPKVCGSVMPRFRSFALLTSSTATSTTTSGRVRSRSLISFCASSNWSVVARITIAFWLGTR